MRGVQGPEWTDGTRKVLFTSGAGSIIYLRIGGADREQRPFSIYIFGFEDNLLRQLWQPQMGFQKRGHPARGASLAKPLLNHSGPTPREAAPKSDKLSGRTHRTEVIPELAFSINQARKDMSPL